MSLPPSGPLPSASNPFAPRSLIISRESGKALIRLPYLPAGSFGAILGASGFGLTTVLLQIAATASVGGDPFGLLGQAVSPAKTAFCVGRDCDGVIVDRLDLIEQRLPAEPFRKRLASNLTLTRLLPGSLFPDDGQSTDIGFDSSRADPLPGAADTLGPDPTKSRTGSIDLTQPVIEILPAPLRQVIDTHEVIIVDGYEAFGDPRLLITQAQSVERFVIALQSYLSVHAPHACVLLGASLARFSDLHSTYIVSSAARSFQTLQIGRDEESGPIHHFFAREKVAGNVNAPANSVLIRRIERREDGTFYAQKGQILGLVDPKDPSKGHTQVLHSSPDTPPGPRPPAND